MKTNNIFSLLVVFSTLFATSRSLGQSEGLTSSPYSLYGLGVINQTGIGNSNGMGYAGIGIKTDTEINNLNPANYSLIRANSFFYDIGIKGEYNNYSNVGNSEAKTTFNFASFAMAFRITNGLGVGITMVPYSDVGYSLLGIQTNIEGSKETFESNVTGVGGLNDLRFNIGYGVVEGLRVGGSISFLFGNIEEEEAFQISSSTFQLNEATNYSGVRLGFGLQYDIVKNFTIGSTVQFPTSLKGNLTRSVLKTLDGVDISVEENEGDTAADFDMPLELGVGMSSVLYESLTVSVDYKKNYWSATGQSENIGRYMDQDIYALGLEYVKNPKGFKSWERVRYRAGFNYDNGNLAINGRKIHGFNFTTGVGLPVGRGSNSMINLSYSYGSKGQIQNILIKEDYHMLTLNLSLEDRWFRKRKID